jgi:endogenous inhibitor of DNA gyrase (YacG/DUF329 family)
MATAQCPVCGWDITEEGRREVRIGRQTITVCCDECARAVEADPGKYAR